MESKIKKMRSRQFLIMKIMESTNSKRCLEALHDDPWMKTSKNLLLLPRNPFLIMKKIHLHLLHLLDLIIPSRKPPLMKLHSMQNRPRGRDLEGGIAKEEEREEGVVRLHGLLHGVRPRGERERGEWDGPRGENEIMSGRLG